MTCIIKAGLCFFAAASSLVAAAQTSGNSVPGNRPEEMLISLYRKVQKHAPSGLPHGTEKRVFAPYLSSSLRRRIGLAEACESDWFNHDHGRVVKAPFAWSEFGIFSGGNERTSPGQFRIEKTRKTGDGSFEIMVGFTYLPMDGSGSWRVRDYVIRENGHFVLDDVLFFKDSQEDGATLTHILSEGCKGAAWVGKGEPGGRA